MLLRQTVTVVSIAIVAFVFSHVCFAAAPTSPAAPEQARIGVLVRQLDAPGAHERQQAVEELGALGPEAIPILEAAAEGASFEARMKIQEILEPFQVRGALILYRVVDSPADFADMEAGDVITAVNGVPIESVEDYVAKVRAIEGEPRTLTVRTGPRIPYPGVTRKPPLPKERTMEMGPGKMGVYLGNYDGKYGAPLAMAMQRLYRCKWNRWWAEARDDFERAFAAGLVFDDGTLLEPMYAAACYYAGDKTAAYDHFDTYVRRNPGIKGWWMLMNGLSRLVPCDGHLYLHFARQQLRHDPDDAEAAMNVAYACSWSQARYLEASTTALATLNGDHGEFGAWPRGVGLNALQHALDAMDLVPEAGRIAGQLAEVEEARSLFGEAFPAAARAGQQDLAIKLGEAGIHRATRYSRLSASMAEQVFRYCVRHGSLDDAQRILREYDDAGNVHNLLYHLRECDLRWPESQAILAEFARRWLAEAPDDRDVLEAAFMILSRQTTLDVDELEKIVEIRLKETRSGFRGGDPVNYRHYMATMLALIKEEHDEVEKLLSQATREGALPSSFHKAAAFLREFGSVLTDDQALWKRTYRAFDRPAGGHYLLTRDQHIGWSDGRQGREIPLPEPVWSFNDLSHAFLVSASGKTVLTVGLGRIYKLRSDESGWEPLCAISPHVSEFSLSDFALVLDELVDVIEESNKPIDLVWPDSRLGFYPGEDMDCFMFSDGTWVLYHPELKRLLRVSQELQAALQHPLEIYDIRSGDSALARLWVFTDQGLVQWLPKSGEVATVPLPDADQSLPVMVSRIRAPTAKGVIRIALFPKDGGTTFLLNLSSGEITWEGLVNEAYPETYWRQRSPASKRARFMEAVAREGLTWPPKIELATRSAD